MRVLPLLIVVALSAGCSTIRVESDPPGAEVWVGSKMKGTTPCSFKVSDMHYAAAVDIEVRKEGFTPSTTRLHKYLTWYLGYSWTPKEIHAKLEAAPVAKPGE